MIKYIGRVIIFIGLLTAIFANADSDDWIETEWLTMIKLELAEASGSHCEVNVAEIVSQVIGNNGFRTEHWIVEHCSARVRYEVHYCPLDQSSVCGKQFEIVKESED